MYTILKEQVMRQRGGGMGGGSHGGFRGGGGGGSTDGTRTFSYLGPNSASLNARMGGRQRMSDGATIRTWFFGSGFNGDRTVPSPVIEGIEGEIVQVTLSSEMPHSIHWHGLDVDQANDGVPSTSGYVARHRGGGMNFGRVSGYTNLGSPFTYTFIAPHAGTYMYHCHVDTVLHVEMGMYGTVIIRPPDGSTGQAWTDGPTFDKEYIWHLHTFDSLWHSGMGNMGGMGGMAVSGPGTVHHRPDYFMINGRDGVNTLTDPTTAIEASAGQKVLIRATNVGYQLAEVQFGGLVFDVIASDGRPLAETISTSALMIAPGERYDILLTMPSSGSSMATVDYLHIRGDGTLLGTASTSITVV